MDGVRCLGARSIYETHVRGSLLQRKVESQESIADDGMNCVDSTICRPMDLKTHRKVAEKLGAVWPGTEMWSTQLRYVAMVVADCDLMLRIPKSPALRAKIWDHAGGVLTFKESSGHVTDLDGKELNFTAERRLKANRGMIVARQGMHAVIFNVMRRLLKLMVELLVKLGVGWSTLSFKIPYIQCIHRQ